MLVPPAGAAESLMPFSPTAGATRAPPAVAASSDGDRRGWLQLSAISPLFSAAPDGAAAGGPAASGMMGGFDDTASLSSPIPGLLASVKNLALREEEPAAAAQAGYGSAPTAAGGWMGGDGGATGGLGPRGEADCAMRLGKTAEDEFTLLCGPPLSPLQGFAIAIGSLTK